MKIFLIYIRDEDFYRLLPPELGDSRFSKDRVQVMAFPPIGIETLAPIIRQHGHEARMFDTCHPLMKAEHIAEAVCDEKPDVIALSFLSTTSYPATLGMAQRLKQTAPDTPVIVGGVFATINAKEILADSPAIDCVAKGEDEELLPEFLENLRSPGKVNGLVWRSGSEIVENPDRPIIENLAGEVVNRARQEGYMLLFSNRLFLRPFQTLKLLRRFGRYMKKADIMKLLFSPFRKRTLTLKPSLPSPMIDLGLTVPVREAISRV